MNLVMIQLGSVLLILAGACILFLSIRRTKQMLALLRQETHLRDWRWLFVLMNFFLAGYGGAALLVLADQHEFLVLLTGVVFFFGAIFVYIVVRLQHLTFHEVMGRLDAQNIAEASLRRVNQELERRAQEFAALNIIAQTVMQTNDLHATLEIAGQAVTDHLQQIADVLTVQRQIEGAVGQGRRWVVTAQAGVAEVGDAVFARRQGGAAVGVSGPGAVLQADAVGQLKHVLGSQGSDDGVVSAQ